MQIILYRLDERSCYFILPDWDTWKLLCNTVKQIGRDFPLAAPTLLGGKTPWIARGDEHKVSINFY